MKSKKSHFEKRKNFNNITQYSKYKDKSINKNNQNIIARKISYIIPKI